MEKPKKILFVIPDGVGIRNYIYSSLIKHISKQAKLFFWTTLPNDSIKEVEKLHNVSIHHMQFSLPRETILTRLYRESATYGRLRLNASMLKNPTILGNWKKSKKPVKSRILYFLAQNIGRWASKKYERIVTLEKKAIKNWDSNTINKFKEQLRVLSPDTIFITHQRVAFLNPICIAAKELNIKVISSIYSWDNTAKASLAVKADTYLVWSDYMKDELSLLYPEIDKNAIVVTGTPQFEFYFQQERIISRADFAKQYGLDFHKQWICFSGDDIKTSPFDPEYLKDLAKAVSTIPEKERPSILFRRCPVDVSDRYDKVIKMYPNLIIKIDPVWNIDVKSWGAVYPKQEDIDLLVNTAFHCELVVNLGSTMAHDFAIFDKPCFYINYDQNTSYGWSVNTIYNYQHFRSIGTLDAVAWFNSKEEIKEKIMKGLRDPKSLASDKRSWMRVIVKHPLEENAKLIANQLLNDSSILR